MQGSRSDLKYLQVVRFIAKRKQTSSKTLYKYVQKTFNISYVSCSRLLSRLVELDLIERLGNVNNRFFRIKENAADDVTL